MKRCIVNVANRTGWYLQGQNRLKQSIDKHGEGVDFINFVDEGEIGSPRHLDNPYAFKLYAIQECRNRGYDQILYLDASIWLEKSIKPIWDIIDEQGYMVQEDGNLVGHWCNARALKYFGLTREEANKIVMHIAGATGLDFRTEIARKFFDQWFQACKDGIFRGSWSDHRHDMTCAGVIGNRLGLKHCKGGTILAYIGTGYTKPMDSACLYLAGM